MDKILAEPLPKRKPRPNLRGIKRKVDLELGRQAPRAPYLAAANQATDDATTISTT
jgi:hypothetical protein